MYNFLEFNKILVNTYEKSLLTYEPFFKKKLSNYTSIKIGGQAEVILKIPNITELLLAIKICKQYHIPWFIIGKGSNLLFHDHGFAGVIIVLVDDFASIHFDEEMNKIIVGAGMPNAQLTSFARKNALSGLEFLAQIPGSIGGAVYMNAGAFGASISNCIYWVEWLTWDQQKQPLLITSPQQSCNFSYRHSFFINNLGVILKIALTLKKTDSNEIKNQELFYKKQRQKKQPYQSLTCGSVFKNPPDTTAGELIDKCGLKGLQIGNARISPLHANFIENLGDASSKDVIALIEIIQKEVQQKFKIQLQLELQIINSLYNS